MTQLIIHLSALSSKDMLNLKEFNREHKPIIITVISEDGYSQRFKLTENELKYIDVHIPVVPTGRVITI